jgi:hypothetical protein
VLENLSENVYIIGGSALGATVTIEDTNLFAATGLTVLFNSGVVAANSNLFTPALAPNNVPCTFRFTVTVNPGVILNLIRTFHAVSITESFNGASGAPNAGSEYIFDTTVHNAETINFQMASGTTLLYLSVDELDGMTG